MEIFTISKAEITGRLDCFYYRPEFTDLEKVVLEKTDKTLGDFIIEIAGGATPRIKDSAKYYTDDPDIGVPFLRVQNVSPEGLELDDVKLITPFTHENLLKRSQVKEFDLITKITGVGRMAISSVAPEGFEGNINQHLVVIKTKDHETSSTLASFLNTDVGDKLSKRRSTGGTRPALDYQALRTIPIIFKPEIVKILDKAYQKKKQNEEEAERLRGLSDVVFSKNLGVKIVDQKITNVAIINSDDVLRRLDPLFYVGGKLDFIVGKVNLIELEKVCVYLKSGFAAGKDSQAKEETEVIQIRPTNINSNGELYFDKNIYIDSAECEKRKDYLLQRSEVLFNNTNSQVLVGKSAYFDLEGLFFCSNHITRIRTNPSELMPKYLWVVLNLYQRHRYFFNICTNWNNQSGVNINLLKEIKIPLPDKEIQMRIVEEIEENFSQAEKLINGSNFIVEKTKNEIEQIMFE